MAKRTRSPLQIDYRSDDKWSAYDPDTRTVLSVIVRRGPVYECVGCTARDSNFTDMVEHVNGCSRIRR